MQTSSRKSTGRTAAAFSLIACLFLVPDIWASALDSAAMLPSDTTIMLSVESVSGLRAAMEKTALYGLYQDPAMRPIVTQARQKIRERIDKGLKEFWQEARIENPPEKIPLPQGRLVVGLSIANRPEAAGPDAARRSNDPGVDVRLALMADMGDQAESLRQLMRSLSASATRDGDPVERKEVAGVELDILAPKTDGNEPIVCYGMKDNWLLVTVDMTRRMDFTESVAGRIGRSLPGSLRESPALATAVRTLGDAHAFVFVNPQPIRSLIAAKAGNKVMAERVMKGLGILNVTSLAGAVQVAGRSNQDLCTKSWLGVEGPRTGIPALLGVSSGPLKVDGRFVTRDAVGFLCGNYEPLKIFDTIAGTVGDIAAMDLNMMIQAGMMATAEDGGLPPVQLRDEVLSRITGPLLATWKVDKPGTDSERVRFLVALSARESDRLDAAVARIHRAFAGVDPQLRREFLGRTLYLLPGPGSGGGVGETTQSEAAASTGQLALAVAGDNLILGQVAEVEQAIRSLQKEPDNSIVSDPMFRYAREQLPSQAGMYVYRNNRLDMQMLWAALRQVARDLPAQGADASADKDFTADPIAAMLHRVREYVDLSRLPEFTAVEKYWGASVGYMQSRPDGIYGETTVLKPAP
jgi:hypothetical protein